MDAILAVNHFLTTQKYNTLHRRLIDAAKSEGINLFLKTNLELATQSINTDFVLFWDKDINLARRIEKSGIPVFNSADSIEKCDDKARTYLELNGIVPQPKTLASPKCYFKSDMSEFIDEAIKILGLPLVFKECFGSFGAQVHLCKTKQEIADLVSEKPFILQEYISSSAGHDIRLEIVGGKCVGAAERFNPNDFRSNVTNGGTMKKYIPSQSEVETAINACNALGLTFGGVDLLDGGIVCEVNSNAHIVNLTDALGIDIAPMIFDEIKKKIV